MDLSSLSNSDLEALASGNLQGMSTEALELIAGVTDQRKAHEAKTGIVPAAKQGFQGALGSADVGIAGALKGLGFPEEAAGFEKSAKERQAKAQEAYEPTTEEDVAAAEARGTLPGFIANLRKNVSEPIGGMAGRFGPTTAAVMLGGVPGAALAGGAEYLTSAGEIQERGGSPEAAYTMAAPVAALNTLGLPLGPLSRTVSGLSSKVLGRAVPEVAEQSVLGAAKKAQEVATQEGLNALGQLEGKAVVEAEAAPFRAATKAASEKAAEFAGTRTKSQLAGDIATSTLGNVAVATPTVLAQEAMIRAASGEEQQTLEEMQASAKQMALLSPFFGALHGVMRNPNIEARQKAMETAEGIRTRPEALAAEENIRNFAEPEVPEPTKRGATPVVEEPVVEEPVVGEEPVVEPLAEEPITKPATKIKLGKELGFPPRTYWAKELNKLDTTNPDHVLDAADIIKQAEDAGYTGAANWEAVDGLLKRADEYKTQKEAEPANVETPTTATPTVNLKSIPTAHGASPIVDYGERKFVVVDVNGTNVPFYLSTGLAGKKDVAAGKWYPVFGIDKQGWINKGSQKEINNHYGSPELASVAKQLDDQIGDIRTPDGEVSQHPEIERYSFRQNEHDKAALDFINSTFAHEPSRDNLYKNIEDIKQKVAKSGTASTKAEPLAPKVNETLQAKTDALKANAAEATPKTTKEALKATLDHDVAEQEAKLDELDKFDEPAPETPEAANYTGTAADAKDALMADRLSVMRDFEKPSIAQAVKDTAKNFIYNHVDKYAPAIGKIGRKYGEYVDDGHLNAGLLGHQHDQAHTLMTNAFQEGGLEFDKSGQVRIRRKELELSDGRKMNASLGNMVKLADETGADGRDVLSEVLRTLDEERQLKLDPTKASVWVTKNPEAFQQKVAAAHQLLKDKPIFNDMINMNREVNKMRIDFLRDSGQIDKDTHAFFLTQDDYVPRYLTREDTLDLLGPSKGRKIRVGNTQTRVFQERDVANHDVNPLDNIGREFTRSYLGGWSNNLKRLSAEQLVKTGNAEYVGRTNNPAKQGNVAVLHNGERQFYKLNDPNDIPAMRIADDVLGPFMQAHAAATQTLRLGSLNTPFYFIKQLSRDPIAATLTSDLGWITPLHSLREVSGLLTNNKETRRIYNKLHDYGVIGAIDPTMSPRQLGSFNKEMGTRLKSSNSLGMAKLKMINSLEFTHKAIDASTRIAVFREAYSKAIREGKSHEAAEEYAVMKARESINFSVGGNAELQRKARMLVPFLGSGINALEVLRKAIMMPHIKESERAAFRKQFLNKAYTVGMLAGAHALMMAGDPDYDDAEDSFKYNNLLIPTGLKEPPFFGMSLPPDLAFLYWIPSMLVSATLGTKDSSQLWGAAREQLKTMVPGNLAYSYGIPQLERPLLEGVMGKSFYTGQDIESASEKGKLPENRGEYTASGVGKTIGKAGGISPTIIDHMARGYLGEIGKAAAWFADTLLDATGVSDGVTKPELDWTQIPGTSAQTAFGRHLGSQALDDFYTRKEEADVLRKTFNDYRKSGDLHADDLKEFIGDKERMLKKSLADDMDRYAKQISNLNNQIRMVERSKLSKEEVTDRVERFKIQRNKLAAVANAKWKATMEQ